jgi:hypothetical protein
VLAGAALELENLVAEISPVTISSSAMVEEKGWLSGVRIFEPGEQLSTLDSLGALLAVFQFRHDFLAFRETLSVVFAHDCDVVLHSVGVHRWHRQENQSFMSGRFSI